MMQRKPARWFQRRVSDFMKTSAKTVKTSRETTSWMTLSSQIEKGPPELGRTDAVGRDLEAVFEEGDAPTQEDDGHGPETFEPRFEGDMPVPGQRHEGVGDDEQQNGGKSPEHKFHA